MHLGLRLKMVTRSENDLYNALCHEDYSIPVVVKDDGA